MSVLSRAVGRGGIGLGLAAIGRPAYINLGRDDDLGDDRRPAVLEARAHALLDAAWDAGVRYVDAARSYGRAEEFLASWLAARPDVTGEIVVGSKWGYTYVGEWSLAAEVHESKDLTRETLRRQLAETRALLGDQVQLYQIHSATIESGVLDDAGVLAELAELRGSGVAIGLSTSGPTQAATVDRAVELGAFDTVQSTWNLLERSVGPALQRAHEAGMGVIVKEALANGRLADRTAAPEVVDYAHRHGVSADAVALAAAVAQPWCDIVLSGAVTTDMLASNLRAEQLRGLDPAAELAALTRSPEAYWQERSELPWQ